MNILSSFIHPHIGLHLYDLKLEAATDKTEQVTSGLKKSQLSNFVFFLKKLNNK